MIFGLILGCTFPLYFFDPQNATQALAGWIGHRLQMNPDSLTRLLFALAALVMVVAALIRTWASAYLQAGVVYASAVKADFLVADGPYRHVRNPLYFANVLMAMAMGTLMSRIGFLVAVLAMVVFCYRLILREEYELQSNQGALYSDYRQAVPRLWPGLWPRIPSAGRPASWAKGWQAEAWFWGFAAALIVFAITLQVKLFFVVLGASLVWFWVSSAALDRKKRSQP